MYDLEVSENLLRKGNGNGVNLVVICDHLQSVQNRPGDEMMYDLEVSDNLLT